jgi:hypothetical protein
MAKDLVNVQNWNKTQKELFSADGDSIHIMPGIVTPVEKKFLWNLPKGVEEYKETFTVFNKKVKEVDVTEKSGNLKGSDEARKAVSSGGKPISSVESAS